MNAIELRGVSKSFDATRVLDGLDLAVQPGAIVAVLGASGSGKTTLLRLIVGFERADRGSIELSGRMVDDGRRAIPAQHRGVGYVPQDGALFPHLNVLANVSFGLPGPRRGEAGRLIEMVGLDGLERRFPHELSGGQQQRVALARALAIQPAVVLLDEPFSSLDASLRSGLAQDVVRILRETGTTAVLVTHDQDEALAFADLVAVLRDGHVAALDAPRGLYRDPPDLAAAHDIGDSNVLMADVHDGLVRCALGQIQVQLDDRPAADGPARLVLRPEQLALVEQAAPDATEAAVVSVQFHGHDALVSIRLVTAAAEVLIARVPGEQELAQGQPVWVRVVGKARVFPA